MRKTFKRFAFFAAVAVATAFASGCAGFSPPAAGPAAGVVIAAAPASGTSVDAPSLAASGVAAIAPAQQAAQKVHALAVTVDKYCQVGQPFVQTMMAQQTDPKAIVTLGGVQHEAGKVCSAASSIAHPAAGAPPMALDVKTVSAFANTQVPRLLTLVKNTDKLDDKARTVAEITISAVQTALLLAAVNAQ